MSLQPTTLLTFDANGKAWLPYHSSTSAPEFPSQYPLRVVTWNIWEDPRHHHLRHEYIISTLLSNSSGKYNDILCLQEVTTLFFKKLLAHTAVRNDWLITDLEEQFRLCANCYSSVVMIRRKHGDDFKLASAYMEFPNTRMARGFIVVQFCLGDRVSLRIGTAHFESHYEDVRKRREQFETAACILTNSGDILSENINFPIAPDDGQTTSVPAILTGDCNVRDYNELNPLITGYHFRDAFRIAHPIFESPFFAHPTYGITLTNRRKTFMFKVGPPKRLDYIFVRGVEVKEGPDQAGFLGNEPVCTSEVARDEEGKDGKVWASDHLSVWVDVNLCRPDEKIVSGDSI